jgi:nucleotide-binding universal stress UspA family protein
MQAFRSHVIVAGVDTSDLKDAVLERALDLAGKSSSHAVHVLRVVEPNRSRREMDLQTVLETAHQELERDVAYALTNIVPTPEQAAKYRVRVHVRPGHAEEEIAELAAEVRAHIIVVGSHGVHRRHRLFVGSVPATLLRIAPCPVLVERPTEYEEERNTERCTACDNLRQSSDGERWFCDQHAGSHPWRTSFFRPGGDYPLRSGGIWF